jgi:parallel beta-helix repeat protein
LIVLQPHLSKVQPAIPRAIDPKTEAFLTLATNPSPSLIGQRVKISGTCTDSQGHSLAGQSVIIRTSFDAIRWDYRGTARTDDLGCYSLVWQPSSSGRFYVSATYNDSQIISEHVSANYIVHDTAELQNATRKGGTVFVCKGQYDIYTTIDVASNLLLVGTGDETVLKPAPTKVSGIIRAYNVTQVQIANIKLDGERIPTNFSGCSAIEFYYSTHLFLENLSITNLDKEGLVFNSCSDLMLDRVSISRVWTGIVLRECQDITVQYNTIDLTAGDGIYITGSSSLKGCTNITVCENSLSRIGDTGIDISSSYNATSSLLRITRNNFTECNLFTPSPEKNGIGITLSRCQNVDVKRNIISLPKGGILIGKSVDDAEVEDNMILNYSQYGIWIVTPTNVTGNKLFGGNGSGLRINPSAGSFEISSNVLENLLIAIEWIGPATAITILNNTILNPVEYGIFDGGGDYWTSKTIVANNTIVDTRAVHQMQYGICQTSTRVTWTLARNYVDGASLAPMFLAGKNVIIE